MTSLADLLDRYLTARGMPFPDDAYNARKVAEEAIELVEECSRDVPDASRVAHELADVVLAAAVLARHHGFTVEEAIASKTQHDAGRERGARRE